MSGRKSELEEKLLEDMLKKFETKGVRIWGVDENGNPVTVRVRSDGKLAVDPSVVYVTLQPHFLEKRDTDPDPEVARIYFNTVENRPKICIEQ